MTTTSIVVRPLAIVAGCAFTAGGLFILLGDMMFTPRAWTAYHWLTVLTVFGTVVAGHLVGQAWRDSRYLAVLGFTVLFLAGTGAVVYQSVGRQAETAGTKSNAAEHRNGLIASKLAQRDKAVQDLDDIKQRIAAEVAGWPDAKGRPSKKPGCGPDCKGFERQRDATAEEIARLEREIAQLGAPVPVAPQAEQMASVMAIFGADFAKAKAGLRLMEPFWNTLLFEVGIIVSFGYGFGHRRTPRDQRGLAETPVDSPEVEAPVEIIRPTPKSGNDFKGPDDGSADRPKVPRLGPPDGRKKEVLAAIVTDLALGRSFPKQKDLCETYGVPRSTMSDWLDDWTEEGLIPPRTKVGRCKVLVGA